MSIKDRLSKKTEGLLMPERKVDNGGAPPLRTGPGQMLMVNSLMKENNEKVAQLEARLRLFEGTLPVKLLDPGSIRASKWANRSESSFDSTEYQVLRMEIADAAGNVQPIKVRPIESAELEEYEIVFGHRRHRACLELGLPVLALIDEIGDAELFKEMDRENRARQDLSAWEQGMMYRRALREKLFTSQEQMARELGIDAGNLSKALRLADLDERLVEVFPSPLDLQFRWAKPLSDALRADKDGVLSRAAQLKAQGVASKSPREIYDYLLGVEGDGRPLDAILINGERKAIMRRRGTEVLVRFESGFMTDDRERSLRTLLEQWLTEELR